MRHSIRIVVAHLLLVGALLTTVEAWAVISTVTGIPSTGTVAIGQPATVTMVWRVRRNNDPSGLCGNGTVSSASGTIRAENGNGPILQSIPASLTQTQACPPGPGPTAHSIFTFSETILIPAELTQRAQRAGFVAIHISRQFVEGGTLSSGIGEVILPIVGSAAASLSIAREALAFDNGAPTRVLGLNDPLAALAEISYSGTGLLQAQWELAGPESTAGTPAFRPILQVRQYLTAGDARVFRSPELPTHTAGLYFVRLRITGPEPAFESPVIRYFVLQDRDGARDPAAERSVTLGGPPPRALLSGDTAFVWEAIQGARAYQLEVYDSGQDQGLALPDLRNDAAGPAAGSIAQALMRPAVTGTLVPGKQTRAELSPMARQHLLPGHIYYWRVLAIGQDGRIIGASPMRELRTP